MDFKYNIITKMFSADPKKFMISTLERLQKSKSTKRDYPCLFDDSNIQSVYGMLDPTNRGYITLKQYCEGNMSYSRLPCMNPGNLVWKCWTSITLILS